MFITKDINGKSKQTNTHKKKKTSHESVLLSFQLK